MPVFKDKRCFPTNLVATDLNGDGLADLAVTGFCNRFAVFFSDPKNPGNFKPPKEIKVPTSAIGMAVFHSEGSRFPFIVVSNCANPDSIPQKPLLHIVSMETFKVINTMPSGGKAPDDIAIADFNGDGLNDFAVGHWKEGVLSVLLGKKKGGGFISPQKNSPQYISIGDEHWQVEARDFDNDQKMDIASVVWTFKNGEARKADLLILPGNGKGGFSSSRAKTFPLDREARSFSVADFDRDGFEDIAVANPGSGLKGDGSISFLFGKKGGHFDHRLFPPLARKESDIGGATGGLLAPQGIATADLDGDGAFDLVTASRPVNQNGRVIILYNNGKGDFSFARSQILQLGRKEIVSNLSFEPLIITDLNQDGAPDIAVANTNANTVSIFFNPLVKKEEGINR
ncbi:MAG TPA: FG-GAP-like repeat-containing protein [Nitrospiria bacterium]